MTKQQIWELYLPRVLEYPELENYIVRVMKIKEKILSDDIMLQRFVLASLFPTYRACNHMGCSVSSSEAINIDGIHGERLKNVESIIGFPIKGTQHYLSLIKMSSLKQINPFLNLSNHLIKYVCKG